MLAVAYARSNQRSIDETTSGRHRREPRFFIFFDFFFSYTFKNFTMPSFLLL